MKKCQKMKFGEIFYGHVLATEEKQFEGMFPSEKRQHMGMKFLDMLNSMIITIDDPGLLVSKLRQMAPVHVRVFFQNLSSSSASPASVLTCGVLQDTNSS